MKPRILVVEDEPSIMENILYALEAEGFSPQGCGTAATAMDACRAEPPALVVLDVGLPDASGFDLCREIRQVSAVPVIFLTARSSEIDRVVGLEIGGDDYVVKPFSPRELVARVRAVLRRAAAPAAICHGFNAKPAESQQEVLPQGFHVDEERMQIAWRAVWLVLTATEFRLLRALCRHPGRVYSRGQLMDIAWEDPGSSLERTVDAHIKSLRGKLRDVCPDADPIQTHRGLGYSLDPC